MQNAARAFGVDLAINCASDILHLRETYKSHNEILFLEMVLYGKNTTHTDWRRTCTKCGSKPVEGFYESVKEQWKQYLPESEKNKFQSILSIVDWISLA